MEIPRPPTTKIAWNPLVKVSNVRWQLELITPLTELPVKYIFRTLTKRG